MKASELNKGAWFGRNDMWKTFTNEQLIEIIGRIKFFTSWKGYINSQALIDEIDKYAGDRK